MSFKCGSSAFNYINLVKFSNNLQNSQKRRRRRRFGQFAPKNPKTLQSKSSSAQNPAIEPPSGGRGRNPIISSAWTLDGLGRGLVHPCLEGSPLGTQVVGVTRAGPPGANLTGGIGGGLPPNNSRFLALTPPPNIRIFYYLAPHLPAQYFRYWGGGTCPPIAIS